MNDEDFIQSCEVLMSQHKLTESEFLNLIDLRANGNSQEAVPVPTESIIYSSYAHKIARLKDETLKPEPMTGKYLNDIYATMDGFVKGCDYQGSNRYFEVAIENLIFEDEQKINE